MAWRGNESPMEYEYDNGQGPTDSRSPFMSVGRQQQQQPSLKKRTHSAVELPTQSHPSLRAPTSSQTHLFNRPPSPEKDKPLPPHPKYPSGFDTRNNPSFNTPRTKIDIDFDSSAGETPQTPKDGDSDATPSTMGIQDKLSNMMARTFTSNDGKGNGGGDSPSKRRKQSFLKEIFGNPGKGETGRRDGPYSHKVEKRVVRKRSKKAIEKKNRRRYDSDSEDESSQSRQNKDDAIKDSDAPPGGLGSFFSFLAKHPTLPHILSWYLQLLFNGFLIAGCMFLIYSFWSAIRSDVDKKAEEATAELMIEMASCAKQYRENHCSPETRMPALQALCGNWEKCMNRDPKSYGRARVSAHTFAEIFNSFVEPISWKAMIFCLLICFTSFFATNLAFGWFRSKIDQHGYTHPQHPYQQPPPTPYRYPSGGMLPDQSYNTPYRDRNQMMGFEPMPSATAGAQWGQESPMRSPARQLSFR